MNKREARRAFKLGFTQANNFDVKHNTTSISGSYTEMTESIIQMTGIWNERDYYYFIEEESISRGIKYHILLQLVLPEASLFFLLLIIFNTPYLPFNCYLALLIRQPFKQDDKQQQRQ